MPKQENFRVAGIFNTGFIEFDQNIIFLNVNDALSIFDKDFKDQNIEIYLDDPLKANFYKENIQKLNENYFDIFIFRNNARCCYFNNSNVCNEWF